MDGQWAKDSIVVLSVGIVYTEKLLLDAFVPCVSHKKSYILSCNMSKSFGRNKFDYIDRINLKIYPSI